MMPPSIPDQPGPSRPTRRGRPTDPIAGSVRPLHRMCLESIRLRMNDSGTTLKQLEQTGGIPTSSLSAVLRGERFPSWEITFVIARSLDMPTNPLQRLWRAAAREADKPVDWIDHSTTSVAIMEPENPPLALQALTTLMRKPYRRYARLVLQLDDRADKVVKLVFDLLWMRWNHATTQPGLHAYAWQLLREQVMARAQKHSDGTPDLRTAAVSTRLQSGTDPDTRLDTIFSLTDIFDAIGRLPADLRDAVLLHYSCGYSEQEVALFTGTPSSAVHAHLRHAQRTLSDTHSDPDPGGTP